MHIHVTAALVFVFAVLAVLDIPLYVKLFRTMFGTWENFSEALGLAVRMEERSTLAGQFLHPERDANEPMAWALVALFLAVCAAVPVLEVLALHAVGIV